MKQVIKGLSSLPRYVLIILIAAFTLGGIIVTIVIALTGNWDYIFLNALIGVLVGTPISLIALLFAEAIDVKDETPEKRMNIMLKDER